MKFWIDRTAKILLPVIFLFHRVILCYWLLYLGKVSLKLLFPIDQTGLVQQWVEIRLLLPWFLLYEFSSHYNELAFLKFLGFQLYRSKKTLNRVDFFRPLWSRTINHYFPCEWHINNSTTTARMEKQMTVCISSRYRHVLQGNRRCANIFYLCNVIINWRIVIRVELFIIVYIINVLIFQNVYFVL